LPAITDISLRKELNKRNDKSRLAFAYHNGLSNGRWPTQAMIENGHCKNCTLRNLIVPAMCGQGGRDCDLIFLRKGRCSYLHVPVAIKNRLVNLLVFACMQLRKTVFVIGQHIMPVAFGSNAYHKHQQQKTAQYSTYGLVFSQIEKCNVVAI